MVMLQWKAFAGSLEGECTDRHLYQTRRETGQSIFEYMEMFYNRQRLHSSLSYLSPALYSVVTKD